MAHELPPREAALGHRAYQKKTLRIFSVLNAVIAKPESNGWLVDNKPTVVFTTQNNAAVNISSRSGTLHSLRESALLLLVLPM